MNTTTVYRWDDEEKTFLRVYISDRYLGPWNWRAFIKDLLRNGHIKRAGRYLVTVYDKLQPFTIECGPAEYEITAHPDTPVADNVYAAGKLRVWRRGPYGWLLTERSWDYSHVGMRRLKDHFRNWLQETKVDAGYFLAVMDNKALEFDVVAGSTLQIVEEEEHHHV